MRVVHFDHRFGRQSSRGSALIMVAVAMAALAMMAVAVTTVSVSGSRERDSVKEGLHARYVAEAGLAASMMSLAGGGDGSVGTEQQPVGYGNSSYWVAATALPDDVVQLVSTGVGDRSGSRVELTLQRVPNSIWTWGAFGEEELHMDSNALVDSYDSSLGTYVSQAVNSANSDTWANTDGDVGSNGDVTMDSNSSVYGDATCGPDATTSVTGNATVSGSTSPMSETQEFPPIVLPTIATSGNLTVNGSASIASGSKRYEITVVKANATLTITGPATIVFKKFSLASNAKVVVDAAAGPVDIYVIDDFTMNSNTSFASTTKTPSDIRLNLLSDNILDPDVDVDLDDVEFDSNAKLYGTIYAPNAHVEIDSNFELFGALIARRVDLDSNSKVHFDEALLDVDGGGPPTFERICWRELAYTPED